MNNGLEGIAEVVAYKQRFGRNFSNNCGKRKRQGCEKSTAHRSKSLCMRCSISIRAIHPGYGRHEGKRCRSHRPEICERTDLSSARYRCFSVSRAKTTSVSLRHANICKPSENAAARMRAFRVARAFLILGNIPDTSSRASPSPRFSLTLSRRIPLSNPIPPLSQCLLNKCIRFIFEIP